MFLNLAQKTILILAEDAGLSPADLSRLFWLTDKDSRLSLRRVTRKLRPKMRRENSVSLAKLSIKVYFFYIMGFRIHRKDMKPLILNKCCQLLIPGNDRDNPFLWGIDNNG